MYSLPSRVVLGLGGKLSLWSCTTLKTSTLSKPNLITLLRQCPAMETNWIRMESHRAVNQGLMVKSYAKTFPRQQRLHEYERIKDGVSEEWDLIFSVGSHSRKIRWIRWVLFFGFTVGSFGIVWEYFDREDDEDVIVFYREVPAQLDMLIIGSIFWLFHFVAFRFITKLPDNVYYHMTKDCYLTVLRSWMPFLSKKVYVKAQHLQFHPHILARLRRAKDGWLVERYKMLESQRTLYLPAVYFRTGNDRTRMLMFSGREL